MPHKDPARRKAYRASYYQAHSAEEKKAVMDWRTENPERSSEVRKGQKKRARGRAALQELDQVRAQKAEQAAAIAHRGYSGKLNLTGL